MKLTNNPAVGARPGDGSRLEDYDYALPEGRIALRPAVPRDAARLLVHRPGATPEDHLVRDLPALLRRGDRLIVNDSRVLPARLLGTRLRAQNAARVELTLIKEEAPRRWRAFAKPAKRLKAGDRVTFGEGDAPVTADVIAREGAEAVLAFHGEPFAAGVMPLPPYIAAKRAPDARDTDDYQTVFADPPGSVAAPTAGLHFTDELLARLAEAGVETTRVTLHVGPGTFLPVAAASLDEHEMHAERGEVGAAAVDEIARTKAGGGRVIAVGTTALRIVESAAARGSLAPYDGETDLFIRPGFPFRVADGLMTNFHLPRSTLLMLVAAFVGFDEMHAVYAHALEAGYRFYSYGDASLLWRS